MTTNILTVCSANICRSPLAEYVLRAQVKPLHVPVVVRSAGVSAMSGSPMEPAARELAARWGAVDTDEHASQPLTAELVGQADLILTATAGHTAVIRNAVPDASHRVFPIRTFGKAVANLDEHALTNGLDGTGDERFRELIARVDQHRPGSLEDLDVPDPFGGDASYYERAQGLMRPGIAAAVLLVKLAYAEQ